MAEKSVIIIGAGVAGLSVGTYARMNDYHTHIFEQHDQPGGLCTAWKRKGYTFDGCIHWLMGSNPGSGLYRMYQEVGALQGNRLLIRDHWGWFADEVTGQSVDITADLDQLEEDLRAVAPDDGATVKEFMAGSRGLRGFDMNMDRPRELMGPLDGAKAFRAMLPYMKYLRKMRQPMSEFAAPAKSPFLRWLLQAIVLPEMGVPTAMILMASLADGTLSKIEGGSLRFSQAMERRYKDLDGELTYEASVEEILVEGDRAVGVRLADGSTHRADYVVSAADGYSTIFKMLGGRYVDDKVRRRYETWRMFDPILYMSFGVAGTFAEQSLEGTIHLGRPMQIAGQTIDQVEYRLSRGDPTLAPAGKVVVQSMLPTDYDYWHDLYQDRPRYEAEKAKAAEQVLERLEPYLPGLSAKVEVTDVASPVTLERYTRNHHGAFEGWLPTARLFGERIERTLPGLDSFYMAGQWVEVGGGIPPAVAHGSHIAQILCKRDGKPYQAFRP